MVLEVGVELRLARPTCAAAARCRRASCRGGTRAFARAASRRSSRPRRGACLRQRAERERVPGQQALVVEPRPHALRADLHQALADARALLRRGLGAAGLEHVRALEVALRRGAEPDERRLGVGRLQRVDEVVERPDVELALHALGVGVEGGVEAALRAAQLAQDELERLLARPAQQRVVARPATRAGTRGRAARCRRASSRSAGRSRCCRPRSARSRRRSGRRCRRRPSTAASAATSRARRGRAGRAAPRTAGTSARRRSRPGSSRTGRAACPTASSRTAAGIASPEGSRSAVPPRRSVIRSALLADLVAPGAPRVGDRLEHLRPGGHALARLGREVGPGEERHLLGRAGRRSAASRRGRSSPARPPCRWRRRPVAPRDRPSRRRSARSSRRAISGSSKDSRSMTWHQWQAE